MCIHGVAIAFRDLLQFNYFYFMWPLNRKKNEIEIANIV